MLVENFTIIKSSLFFIWTKSESKLYNENQSFCFVCVKNDDKEEMNWEDIK